jgi:hypothetical protein
MTKRLHPLPLSCMLGRKLVAFLEHAPHTFHAHRSFYTQLSSPVEISKLPSRSGHGQNLSERFRRLEKTVLAAHNLNQSIIHAPRVSQQPTPSFPTLRKPPTPATFRGLVIPEVPQAPEPDGGCGHPFTTAPVLRSHRVLHVWLRRLRARFISRITGRLRDCYGLRPCLSHVYGCTHGTMAHEYTP